jgi:membrane-bound metal-dependent hydrolase YbcI (DUF457 family)
MDIGTHALASLALSRAILPRAPKLLWAWTIPAGIIADVDGLSAAWGPATYLAWYRGYLHSLVASIVVACVFASFYRLCVSGDMRLRLNVRSVFIASLLVQWLHLALDATQWQGVELFWPFRNTRVAADWLPSVDPWIIAILIAAVALPEFFHLVSSEIGAKDRKPHGFAAAIVGLTIVLIYVGLRADLHGTAVAVLQNRTYLGEAPRHVGAFSEFTSLVTWRGLAETESALHELDVHVRATRFSMLDPGINLFKPEPSPLLQAAQASKAAKLFLRVARFPRATVQKMDGGSEVQIRDLRYAAAGEIKHEPAVTVDFDAGGKLISEQIVWASRDTPR